MTIRKLLLFIVSIISTFSLPILAEEIDVFHLNNIADGIVTDANSLKSYQFSSYDWSFEKAAGVSLVGANKGLVISQGLLDIHFDESLENNEAAASLKSRYGVSFWLTIDAMLNTETVLVRFNTPDNQWQLVAVKTSGNSSSLRFNLVLRVGADDLLLGSDIAGSQERLITINAQGVTATNDTQLAPEHRVFQLSLAENENAISRLEPVYIDNLVDSPGEAAMHHVSFSVQPGVDFAIRNMRWVSRPLTLAEVRCRAGGGFLCVLPFAGTTQSSVDGQDGARLISAELIDSNTILDVKIGHDVDDITSSYNKEVFGRELVQGKSLLEVSDDGTDLVFSWGFPFNACIQDPGATGDCQRCANSAGCDVQELAVAIADIAGKSLEPAIKAVIEENKSGISRVFVADTSCNESSVIKDTLCLRIVNGDGTSSDMAVNGNTVRGGTGESKACPVLSGLDGANVTIEIEGEAQQSNIAIGFIDSDGVQQTVSIPVEHLKGLPGDPVYPGGQEFIDCFPPAGDANGNSGDQILVGDNFEIDEQTGKLAIYVNNTGAPVLEPTLRRDGQRGLGYDDFFWQMVQTVTGSGTITIPETLRQRFSQPASQCEWFADPTPNCQPSGTWQSTGLDFSMPSSSCSADVMVMCLNDTQ